MQSFTTPKDAQVAHISGSIKIENAENTALQIGASLTSGTVLTLAQGSVVTLVFADGTEQKITTESEELQASNSQTVELVSESASVESQPTNETAPDDVQADIGAIQSLIESGADIELPDTAAGGLTANEGTDFCYLRQRWQSITGWCRL